MGLEISIWENEKNSVDGVVLVTQQADVLSATKHTFKNG